MNTREENIEAGRVCQSCFEFVDRDGKGCGHPRDCAKCKATQLSDKRACYRCGASIRGERGMRDHWRLEHGPKQAAAPEQLAALQEKLNG